MAAARSCALSILTLKNCTIRASSAVRGGGLYTSGTAILTDCTVTGNSALSFVGGSPTGYGGGIDDGPQGSLAVEHCTISADSAWRGAGVYSSGEACFGTARSRAIPRCSSAEQSSLPHFRPCP